MILSDCLAGLRANAATLPASLTKMIRTRQALLITKFEVLTAGNVARPILRFAIDNNFTDVRIAQSRPRIIWRPHCKRSFVPSDEQCPTIVLLQRPFVAPQIILCFRNLGGQVATGQGKIRVEERLHDLKSSFDVLHA